MNSKIAKKAVLVVIIAAAITFVGCSNKYYQPPADLPEEYFTQQQTVLDEHLAILEEEPANLESLFEVGYRYQALGDFKNAIKYYEKILSIDQEHIVVLNNLADIYEQVEEYSKAAEYILRLHDLTGYSTEVTSDTVRILLESGNPAKAEEIVESYEAQAKENGTLTTEEISTQVGLLKKKIEDWKKENQ